MTYTYKYKVGKEPKLCGCGCGELTKYPGANFVHGHHLRIKEFQRKPNAPTINTCKQCGIEFVSKKSHTHKQDFCGRGCANKNKWEAGVFDGQIGVNEDRFEQRNCIACNKEFRFAKSRIKENTSRGKYCGDECRIKDWGEKSLKTQKAGCYRRNAWRIFEKRCYDCGYNVRPEILVIHHIDGIRKNGAISNLVPVCQNCHCIRHIELSGNHRLPSARTKRMLAD